MSDRNNLRFYFVVMVTGMVAGSAFLSLHRIASADAARPPARAPAGDGAQSADLNGDGCVDLRDFARFQNDFTGPIPAWLQEHIDGFLAGDVYYSPGHVWQYRHNEETVFYVPPRCCNVMSVLYDVHGERICHPGGGMSGQGDGRCPEFFDERTDEVLIWEDPRG